MEKEITYLLPNPIIKKIDSKENFIKEFIKKEKSKKVLQKDGTEKPLSISSAKHLSYKKDKLFHLVAYIYTRDLSYLKKKYKGISQDLLTQICGFSNKKQTALHLNILLELNIISRIGTYKPNEKSYDYSIVNINSFGIKYDDEKQFTKIIFKTTIKDKAKTNNSTEQITDEVKEVKPLISENIQKMYKELKEAITFQTEDENFGIDTTNFKPGQISKFEYDKALIKLNEFCDVDINITNNRIMTRMSTFNKQIRKFIKINGNDTISIDIASSQPALLANYILAKGYEITEDLQIFIDYSLNGKIYDYMGDQLFEGDRDAAKELWMSGMYWIKSISTINDEVVRVNKKALLIGKLFPTLVKISDEFKIDNYKTTNGKKEKNYNKLAIYLQRMEAKLVNSLSEFLYINGILNISIFDEYIIETKNFDKALLLINNFFNDKSLKIKTKTNGIINHSNLTEIESNEVIIENNIDTPIEENNVTEVIKTIDKTNLISIEIYKKELNEIYTNGVVSGITHKDFFNKMLIQLFDKQIPLNKKEIKEYINKNK